MNPSQAWSLLTARAFGHSVEPRGFGTMTPDDIRAMLAGLHAEPMLMGMAYHFFDFKSLEWLEHSLWETAKFRCQTEGWEASVYQCRRLGGLALYEVMELMICPECRGKGTTTFEMKDHPARILSPFFEELNEHEGRIRCQTCQGCGKLKMSERKRADLAGFKKDTWRRLWGKRYEEIYALPLGWLEEAHGHLARKTSENSLAA